MKVHPTRSDDYALLVPLFFLCVYVLKYAAVRPDEYLKCIREIYFEVHVAAPIKFTCARPYATIFFSRTLLCTNCRYAVRMLPRCQQAFQKSTRRTLGHCNTPHSRVLRPTGRYIDSHILFFMVLLQLFWTFLRECLFMLCLSISWPSQSKFVPVIWDCPRIGDHMKTLCSKLLKLPEIDLNARFS